MMDLSKTLEYYKLIHDDTAVSTVSYNCKGNVQYIRGPIIYLPIYIYTSLKAVLFQDIIAGFAYIRNC